MDSTMKRYLLVIACLFSIIHPKLYAQFTNYYTWDVTRKAAYQVEDLSQDEIRTYNSFVNSGISDESTLLIINAGRAYENLRSAPATIIDYSFSSEITAEDSIPDAIGACDITVQLINTTPKTIKEITLEFEFMNYGTQVYDIKTGDKYCVLKFTNLKGRSGSDKYLEIGKTLFECMHLLNLKDATYKKLFYNKKATTISLHKVSIRYNDGTTSNKIAIFKGLSDSEQLYKDGPLKPAIDYSRSRRGEK